MKINDKSIYLQFILKQGQGIRYGGNVAFASAVPSRGPFLYTLRETSKHQEELPWSKRAGKVWIHANYTLELEAAKVRPIPSYEAMMNDSAKAAAHLKGTQH